MTELSTNINKTYFIAAGHGCNVSETEQLKAILDQHERKTVNKWRKVEKKKKPFPSSVKTTSAISHYEQHPNFRITKKLITKKDTSNETFWTAYFLIMESWLAFKLILENKHKS